MIRKKIVIATGGTGGHVLPACSLAKNLDKKNYLVQLVTDERGKKYIIDNEKYNLKKIPSSPLKKENFFKLFQSFFIISYATIRSLILLLVNRPTLVFGMGGYSSFPICLAAIILRIKFVVYENNLLIGKANNYLLPFAEKIFVSYNELDGIKEKNNEKIIQVGNIIRDEIINFSGSESKNDNNENIIILVLGGSQAAKIFAEKLPQIFERIKSSGKQIKIFQQCIPKQNDELSKFYKKKKIDYEIFNFTSNIIEYYSKANLVITRSGASVLGELINLRKPFIAIPLPSSADNHQYKNAYFYKKKGCCYLLEEKNISSQLYELINSLINDKTKLEDMISNQRQYSDKDIFENINNHIKKIVNEKI